LLLCTCRNHNNIAIGIISLIACMYIDLWQKRQPLHKVKSLPFGKISGEHGLMFTSYCNTLHNIEVQLLNMFGDADGKTDLLLKYLSKAVSGAYYYAPSVERLQNL